MNMLSVTSASIPSQQVSTQGTIKVEGTAPFQQQLNQYVNQAEGTPAPTQQSTEVVTEVGSPSEVQLDLTVLSAEELMALIEGLLEQVDELTDAPLTEENEASLEAISLQLLALLQLLTVDNKELSSIVESYTQSHSLVVAQGTNTQVNNELLFKLQDQLLLLQQALKDGNLKVVQGQQPEALVSQTLNQLKQLLAETKTNSKDLLVNQLASKGVQVEVNTGTALHQASLEQLKQLAKQSEYSQIASQVQQAGAQTIAQTVEVTPVTQVQHVLPIDAQFSQAVSVLKGQPQSQASAFTTVNQFADTVKGMVLQKFDLTNLTNGLNQARIMLTPEHLGSVDIKLSMQNGVLTAVFQAETAMAKDALENQMSVLRSALAAQGITVERMEVTQASFKDELNWEEQRQQQQTANDTDEEQANDESFEEQLELTAAKELGFGRAVNETI